MIVKTLEVKSPEGTEAVERLLSRFETGYVSCARAVADIIEAVRTGGDEALLGYARTFDSPDIELEAITVSTEELKQSYDLVDADFQETLEVAIDRIQSFHQREMEDSWMQTRDDGTIVGRLVRPVDSCGLYVPGGKSGSTPLVSGSSRRGLRVV